MHSFTLIDMIRLEDSKMIYVFYYWLLWCKMHRPVCRLWLRNPSDGFLELGTNYKYCWYMLPSTIHTTVAHDSHVCKMAFLVVWNNMGTDTFFAIWQTPDSNVFLCVSLRAVDFKGHQKEGGGLLSHGPQAEQVLWNGKEIVITCVICCVRLFVLPFIAILWLLLSAVGIN